MGVHGCSMGAAWVLHGCFMGVAWELYGSCMGAAWAWTALGLGLQHLQAD